MGQEHSEATKQAPMRVNRVFEQPPDAISLYSDFAQIMGTGYEVLLQFYSGAIQPGSRPRAAAPGPRAGVEDGACRLSRVLTDSRCAGIRTPDGPPLTTEHRSLGV